jgi:hypothetical protein
MAHPEGGYGPTEFEGVVPIGGPASYVADTDCGDLQVDWLVQHFQWNSTERAHMQE